MLLLGQITDRELRQGFLARFETLSREQLENEMAALGQGDDLENGSEVSHGGTGSRKRKERLSEDDRRIIQEIQTALGTKVSIARKASQRASGKLTLEFYSNEDLNEIYKRLTS